MPLDKGCTDAQQRYKNTGNKSGDDHRVSFGHVGKELITRVAHYSKLIKLITVVHYSHLCLTTQVAETIAIHLKVLILITTKLTSTRFQLFLKICLISLVLLMCALIENNGCPNTNL